MIDDVALARLVKGSDGRIRLGLASEVRSCRPYPRLADVWDMVAHSAFTQLRSLYALLVLTVARLTVTCLVPPVATLMGAAALIREGGAAPPSHVCAVRRTSNLSWYTRVSVSGATPTILWSTRS